MSKHTKGPWDYTPNPYPDQPFEYVCYDNGKGAIAHIERHTQNHDDWKYRSREEFEANARLITAAPEMLEALKRVLGGGCPAFARDAVVAAIAKAEGSRK